MHDGESHVSAVNGLLSALCRTAMQAYAVQSIHDIIREQISPVLVQLATSGPEVSCRTPISLSKSQATCKTKALTFDLVVSQSKQHEVTVLNIPEA